MGKKIVLSKAACIEVLESAIESNKDTLKRVRLRPKKKAIKDTNEIFSSIIYHLKNENAD